MAIKEASNVVFLGASGEPLPDRLQGPLQRQLHRLVREFAVFRGDTAVVQNLLDQVGQRVAEKLAAGVVIENLEAYIGTAASNAAIDAARRARDALDGPSVPKTEQGHQEGPAATEAAVLWNQAKEVLNAREEEVLIRYFFHGERHTEIAQVLGESPTAIRSRFSRALEKVRRRYASKHPR